LEENIRDAYYLMVEEAERPIQIVTKTKEIGIEIKA
jgi:hypothetical protein